MFWLTLLGGLVAAVFVTLLAVKLITTIVFWIIVGIMFIFSAVSYVAIMLLSLVSIVFACLIYEVDHSVMAAFVSGMLLFIFGFFAVAFEATKKVKATVHKFRQRF